MQDVDKKMEYYKQIYKDKCIARKEIKEDERASAELVIKYPYAVIELKPDIKPNVLTDMLYIDFDYGAVIKDRNTGKILADNVYMSVGYQGIAGEIIRAYGGNPGSTDFCDSGREKYLEVCNQKMIEKFFRKDRK